MARIPYVGVQSPFGNRGPDKPTPMNADTRGITNGLEAATNAVAGIGGAVVDVLEQERMRDQALARAEASNLGLDDQITLDATTDDFATKLRSGEIPWDQAEQQFSDAVDGREVPEVAGLNDIDKLNFEKLRQRNAFAAKQKFQSVVGQYKKDYGEAQVYGTRDKLAAFAESPGADPDAIIAQQDALQSLWNQLSGDSSKWEKDSAAFRDKVYSTNFAARFNTIQDSPEDLGKVKTELAPDGYWGKRLGPEKAGMALRHIDTRISSLQEKKVREADKADKASEKARGDYEKQVLNGLPGTLEQKQDLADIYKNASSEEQAQWSMLFKTEEIVQQVIKQPISQQAAMVRDLSAKAKTQEDKDTADRLTTTINANIAMASNNPVQWLNGPGGEKLPPLSVEMMTDPSNAGEFYANVSDRYNAISAMQKNYGAQVKMNIFTPDELAGAVAAMGKMNPEQKIKSLAALQSRTGGMVYQALIKQIAPEDPVLAKAGELGAINRQYRPDYSDEARAKISSNVALTMLSGSKMIADSKGSTAIDALVPSEDKFRKTYMETVGNAYANNPAALEANYAAAKAYFVGRQSEVGGVSDKGMKNDQRLIKESILAVSGRVVERNGYSTFAPYGMDESTFTDKADAAIRTALSHLPEDQRERMADLAGLVKAPDGRYALVYGKTLYQDRSGRVLYVSIK